MIFYSTVLRSILYCMSFRRSYNFPVGVGPIVLRDYLLVVKAKVVRLRSSHLLFSLLFHCTAKFFGP
jgi:hypothetical protein